MIRHATLLLVLILAPLTSCASRAKSRPAPKPVTLTVVTYNIHHGEGMDRKLDLGRIAGIIRACEPDFVALQEVDQGTKRTNGSDQPAELAKMLGMNVVYGPAMDFQGGKYGNAILSRFPIDESGTIALPHQVGGRREPRSAAVATCRLPDRRWVVFISTHLDHTREPSDRLAQAKAINTNFTRGAMAPAILAGDFNCEPGSAPMSQLAEAWKLTTDNPPRPSFPSTQPRTRIDHVLVKPAKQWRVVETAVIEEPVASDHRPVMVKLELD